MTRPYPDVAIATSEGVVDPDAPRLVAALADLGLAAAVAAWDDHAAPFAGAGLTVIRSTWDYMARHDAFVQWARATERLVNPADLVVWNSDKHYLDDLARLGVPVVATTYAARGDDAELPEGPCVVKPTVGGGSRGAARFGADEHHLARAHVDRLAAQGHVAMVQPYLEGIEAGEVDVVVIDGVVTHALRKHAPLGRDAAEAPSGPAAAERCEPTDEELAAVAATLGALPTDAPPCYGRVDLVATPDGPVVLEVELIEPFLFLEHAPEVATALAAALAARLGRSSGEVPVRRVAPA